MYAAAGTLQFPYYTYSIYLWKKLLQIQYSTADSLRMVQTTGSLRNFKKQKSFTFRKQNPAVNASTVDQDNVNVKACHETAGFFFA